MVKMSFTLTSRSVIRFESSSNRENEWKQTLMFFNVDISGGVGCDHQNEIRASRGRERNGKRRNAGGGLRNPIKESATFGEPNKFYAQSRGACDDRGSRLRRRCLGGRRNNSAYSESRRHFHYRTTKPRWNHADIAPESHLPAQDPTDCYVTPDYEVYNGGEDESYQNEEYYLPNQRYEDCTYPEEAPDSRGCYQAETYRESIYESPHDSYSNEMPTLETNQGSYEPQPYRNCSPYYPEDDFNTDCRDSLSQSSNYRPRGIQRQASGSQPPEFAINYNDQNPYSNDYREYKNESNYDRYYEPNNYDYEEPQPLPEPEHQIRNSVSKHFDYEDYDDKWFRTPHMAAPKHEHKFRKYKSYQEMYPTNQSRNYKTENEKFKDTDLPLKLSQQFYEPRSCHKNSCKRPYYPEKVSPRLHYNNFKRAREASEQYNRITEEMYGLSSPKKYEDHFKANEKPRRRNPEKNNYNLYLESEIPQPYRKYIKKEVPRTNFKHNSNDDIPRRQRNSAREPSLYYGKTISPKKNDHHDHRGNRNSSSKKKTVDFGSEIPHRICKGSAPAPVFFTTDIPYKRKDQKRYFAHNVQYVPPRPHSGCDAGGHPSNSPGKLRKELSFAVCGLQKAFKPKSSLYEMKKHRHRKTIREKLSGFFKRSKMCLKRSNIFRDKPQKIRNCKLFDGRDNRKSKSALNSPKASDCFLQRNKFNLSIRQKKSISSHLDPSLDNRSKKCPISRIGTKCHYPTVFRGKCTDIVEGHDKFSMYNLLSYSKCDNKSPSKLSNRISSGSCNLYVGAKKNEPIKESQINDCLTIRGTDVSLAGSPRITSSKVISSHDQSESTDRSRQVSGSTLCDSCSGASKENKFKNVRFSPAPSICRSDSSSSNSSQNSRGIHRGVPTPRIRQDNRQNIEECSKPPGVSKSKASEAGSTCPRRRIETKWSLTRKSCCHQSNQRSNNTCSPDKFESNNCRPPRPGLFLPNSIEMCSRPPTMIQCELNKRSSLKGVNNNLERTSNKNVSLKTSSSMSCLSKKRVNLNTKSSTSCIPKFSSVSSTFDKAKEKVNTMEKLKCHISHYQMGNDQRNELTPRKTCSWPRENPRSCPPRRTRSDCIPKVSNKTSDSTMSRCAENSLQESLSCSPENMQLVCLPNSPRPTALPCSDSPGPNARGSLCCPKWITNWDKESCCHKSIVEELKRELLENFKTEQQIEAQSPSLRPTPHIVIFPCVRENICQARTHNPFYRPESVVCWAACSKPSTPF